MKKFADMMADIVIETERERIDDILTELTKKIRDDFVEEVYRLVDEYYDNYVPARYVRLYAPKRKLRTKKGTTKARPNTSKAGAVSLYEALHKMEGDDPIIGVYGGNIEEGYVGGVIFDSSKLGYRKGMRHPDKGITEWNILENFVYAGEGIGNGDWRSVSAAEYDHHSADADLQMFMTFYKTRLDEHYKAIYKKHIK